MSEITVDDDSDFEPMAENGFDNFLSVLPKVICDFLGILPKYFMPNFAQMALNMVFLELFFGE